jgi:hypothetical protein
MEKIQMARPKKDEYAVAKDLTAEMVKKPEDELDINDMPLTTLGEYLRYNVKARELNKKLRICRYPIKQCPEELHPKETVQFNRNDGNTGSIPAYLSNEKIHFDKKLEPGKIYTLPRCVVEHLAGKGTAQWRWFSNADGSKETRVSHTDPRFSIRTIYAS